MRMIVLAALVTVAIGLLGTPHMMAAPVNGNAVGQAAAAASPVIKVPCAMRRVCGRGACVYRRYCW